MSKKNSIITCILFLLLFLLPVFNIVSNKTVLFTVSFDYDHGIEHINFFHFTQMEWTWIQNTYPKLFDCNFIFENIENVIEVFMIIGFLFPFVMGIISAIRKKKMPCIISAIIIIFFHIISGIDVFTRYAVCEYEMERAIDAKFGIDFVVTLCICFMIIISVSSSHASESNLE